MRRATPVRIRVLFSTVLGGGVAMGLLAAQRALASDCPPGGYEDCRNAAQTAENPLIPLIGAGLGAVGAGGVDLNKLLKGGAGGGSGDGKDQDKEKEKEKKPKEPCQDQKERMETASQAAKMLQSQAGTMRDLKNSLDQKYESTRMAGYGSGVVDVAFLAGSVWSKPLGGVLRGSAKWALQQAGKEYFKETMAQKLAEAAAKTMTKELFKDFNKVMAGKNVKWEDLILKPAGVGQVSSSDPSKLPFGGCYIDGAAKKQLFATLKDTMINSGWAKDAAEQYVDFASDSMSSVTMALGVLGSKADLAAIREHIKSLDDQILKIEDQMHDAMSELQDARSALNACVDALPVHMNAGAP